MADLIPFYVLLALVVGGHLWLLDRRDRRDRAERAELHQRFQAPHAAIAEHHQVVTAAPVESDGGLPMTDEEMAKAQSVLTPWERERDRLIAQMEAMENGTARVEDGVLQ